MSITQTPSFSCEVGTEVYVGFYVMLFTLIS